MTEEERKKKTEEFLNKAVVLRSGFLTFCDVKTALFLSQCLYWQERANGDGWFYKSAKEWQAEIGLSRIEQERAKKILENLGILETKLCGIPATRHFKINLNKIFEIISEKIENIVYNNEEKQEQKIEENMQTSLQKICKQDCTKYENKIEENMQTSLQKICKQDCTKYENKIEENMQTNTIDYTIDYNKDYALDYNKDYTKDLDKDKVLVKKLDKNKVKNRSPVGEAFDFFNQFYEKLYNTKYLRNAKTMSQMKRIVESLREDEVKDVIEAFLNCREANVIKRAHDLGILLMDLQKYKVMSTNKLKIIDASKIERKAKIDDAFERAEKILAMRRERCSTESF